MNDKFGDLKKVPFRRSTDMPNEKHRCVPSRFHLPTVILLNVLSILFVCSNPFAQAEGYSTRTEKIRKQFETLAAQWQVHSREIGASSNLDDYLALPEYKKLVKLGRPSIPLIMPLLEKSHNRNKYTDEQDFRWWTFLLEDITGIKHANRRMFRPAEEEKFWLKWWQDQLSKEAAPN
jgi:hypothetical protein